MAPRKAPFDTLMQNTSSTLGIVRFRDVTPAEEGAVPLGLYDVELLERAIRISLGICPSGSVELAQSSGVLLIRPATTRAIGWIAVAPRVPEVD
jgi:hypothetical protein